MTQKQKEAVTALLNHLIGRKLEGQNSIMMGGIELDATHVSELAVLLLGDANTKDEKEKENE